MVNYPSTAGLNVK